ncbi:hypothetical protein I3760_03G143000 [Carya illinoinensis]|nr:hypothetical protein I3760_03G143000 [Carya illinoinensis]KAG2716770.1 hypothetical protein I3760_03G143000 [Carya illinoinensis]KAG2716771.1 hypothetical protein I3760_03G143000 [Carya illinoinensis]
MVLQAVRPWTLGCLIEAFLELFLAYILLCVSAFAFLPSKFFSLFGLHLPCPCNGVFGYKVSNLCMHDLLVNWPKGIIYSVHKSVMSKFPFNLVWFDDQACNSGKQPVGDGKCESGVVGLEKEASCSSFSSSRLQNMVDRERGYDVPKRIMNLKQRSGLRRRRRAVLENRQFYSVLPNDYSHSVVAGNTTYDGAEMRGKTSESLGPVNGREIPFMGETNGSMGIDVGERSQHNFELSESFGEGNGISSSVEINIIKSPAEFFENEVDTIRILELALEEEKAARSALYLELEKERAAAASAAEEAIAMISRLQQDKASVEMEARQYQRMIEEKCAYDEEEMNILKEILVRRERENHFLEKEIEEYRRMSFRENELPKDDLHDKKDKWGQMPSSSLERNDNEQLMLQSENNMPIGDRVGSCANCSSNYKDPLVEKQRQIYGYGCLEKNVLLAGEEKGKEDNGIVCQQVTGEAAITMVPCDGEELEKDGKYKDKSDGNPHGSMLETEPAVYDVYVVDDRNENCNEQSGKESGLFSNAVNEPRDSVVTMGASGVWSREAPSDHPTISRAGTEPNIDKGRLDIGSELPVLSLSRCKSLLSDLGRESLSAFGSEKLKIDSEIERLRECLQIVQGEKENLTLYTENVDREKDPLRLLLEISKQLREIQQLRDPTQQAFLPPSSSKVILKKRCSQTVSCETYENA